MDGLLLMWRNDGCKKGCRSIGIDGCNSEFSVEAFVYDGCTIEAYPAIRMNRGCNGALLKV